MSSKTPKPICERIGQRIRDARVNRRGYLRQRQLAEMCEISPKHMCDIEMGRTEPGAGIILRLCRALKISADDLLGVNETE